MERLVISIARILFSKNIPFCIYRFPNEQKINIAIDKTLLEANYRKNEKDINAYVEDERKKAL